MGFRQAKKIVHRIRLRNREEWNTFVKSGNKSELLPSRPDYVYRKYWKGWGDWLGTNTLAVFNYTFLPFEEARIYTRALKLKSWTAWTSFCKLGVKPANIPSNPDKTYKKEWRGWGDWLGTGAVAWKNKKYRSFPEARAFVHELKFKGQVDWNKYCTSDEKPPDIPSHPSRYPEWKGWGDWLGTGTVANTEKTFRSFSKAKKFVHNLDIKNRKVWYKYAVSGKPEDIPAAPNDVYKKEWKGWGDWLGTGAIAAINRKFKPFEEARSYARSLKLVSKEEWTEHCRNGNKPDDIPNSPVRTYKNKGWSGWGDFLGTYRLADQVTGMNIHKVKELIRDLIKNKVIDEWSADERYHLLTSNGVLNLRTNPWNKLLNSLVIGPRTEEQRTALEKFANSEDDKNIPDLGTELIPTLSTEELAEIAEKEENNDPLVNGNIQTPHKILSQTEHLESICQDIELMQFFVYHFVYKLWKSVFREQDNGGKHTTVNTVRAQGVTGKKFHDTVVKNFLQEYDGMKSLVIPKGYSFQVPPRIMQRYTAFRIKRDPYFCNLSGTGAGKTLSAILASRVIDSKMTLVVCPNDVVEQWATSEGISITAIFPDSKVIIGKPAFRAKYNNNVHQYLILNYDKFSQADSQALILKLVKEKIDFVVLDEIQFVKKRHEEKSKDSQRRHNLGILLTKARRNNSQLKVIGMSATPVINNLEEGKSLLQFVTGKMYEDLATRGTVQNAMSLHQKLSTISIREIPEYKSDVRVYDDAEVSTDKPQHIRAKELKNNPLLIEQYLTEARIPEIIKRIKDQTIIYTEYVTGIVQQLKVAVEDAGFSCAEYTGTVRSGLKRFIHREVQVLIASRPISVGVEGLQKVCNNLIINTLPWTHAQYEQLIGRLHRIGQYRDTVHVHIIKASMSGYRYDQNKWYRIQFKQSLADCAVDGRVPKGILQSKEQMQQELIKWLERLERNEISIFGRSNLNVEPSPILASQIQQRQQQQQQRNLSEFSRLNNKFNNSKSETLHKKIQENPQLLEEYHDKLDEVKKQWPFDPVNVIASKINGLKLPAHIIMKLVIGDFGCGRAKLADLLKENKMYNFDHDKILNDNIIACDMKSVPLKKDGQLDVAVFCLSLMEENWPDYIVEARRCLAKNGLLFIAETTKSLSGRLSRLRDIIKERGFEIYADQERGDFTFVEAMKL